MALFRKTSIGDAHWSKDFVEHLRAVHTALLIVTVVTIAISRAPNTAQLQRAQHDLQVISQAIETAQHRPDDPDTSPHFQLQNLWLTFQLNKKAFFSAPPDTYITVQTCYLNNRDPSAESDRRSSDDWETTFGATTKTLRDFIDEWDDLSCGQVHEFEINDEANYLVSAGMLIPYTFSQMSYAQLTKRGYSYLDWSPIEDKTDVANEEREETKKLKFEKWDTTSIWDMPGPKSIPDSLQANVDPRLASETRLLVHVHEVRLPDFEHPLTGLVPEWTCRKKFAECFYDLDRASRAIQQYPLKEASGILAGEIARNERQFEVLGIKFPAEDEARWGIFLVLVILLYFYLHLRELSPRILPGESGLEVAWIGLYYSWPALSAVWISIAVAPCLAIILLGLEGAEHQLPVLGLFSSYWQRIVLWVVLPGTIASALAISCCFSLARLARLATRARQSNESAAG